MKLLKTLSKLMPAAIIIFFAADVYSQAIDAISISQRIKEHRKMWGMGSTPIEKVVKVPFKIKFDFSDVPMKTCSQLHQSLEERKATISNAMTYLNNEKKDQLDVDLFLGLFDFSAMPSIKHEVKITVIWEVWVHTPFLVHDPSKVPDDHQEFELIGPGMQWDGKNYLLPPFLDYQDKGDFITASYKMSVLDFCFGRNELFLMPKRIKYNWTLSAHWRSELHIADQRGEARTVDPTFYQTTSESKFYKDIMKGQFPVPKFGIK